MADHEDFDDHLDNLLDSVLEDFRKVDSAQTQPKSQESSHLLPSTSGKDQAPLGQGLGLGLPTLSPGKKKSGSTKSRSSTSNQPAASTSRPTVVDPSNSSMAATLEKLAAQTRQTVESMEASPSDEDAMGNQLVENLVKQFEDLGGSQVCAGTHESATRTRIRSLLGLRTDLSLKDMQSIMDTMMRQLLSKDILHEPMKEIGERYPEWLEVNKSKLSHEDFVRYSRQHQFIVQLCKVYDTTPDDFQKIVDLMHSMQDCGQPPSDIVRELAPGLELGEDGLPVLPDFPLAGAQGGRENCNIM
ncbi:hypothetical protein O6H91_01G020500 [Diphasiastrum complanatum]|uniref:Uncharacterized protein n=1 Tax=Diphasiastrum complanatum TaxID=34168 RepID=A0ACC2ENT3_DIPCM|nr:hypothetical protein O6H91_01G020500 [Diphasiastrum complanatum]